MHCRNVRIEGRSIFACYAANLTVKGLLRVHFVDMSREVGFPSERFAAYLEHVGVSLFVHIRNVINEGVLHCKRYSAKLTRVRLLLLVHSGDVLGEVAFHSERCAADLTFVRFFFVVQSCNVHSEVVFPIEYCAANVTLMDTNVVNIAINKPFYVLVHDLFALFLRGKPWGNPHEVTGKCAGPA